MSNSLLPEAIWPNQGAIRDLLATGEEPVPLFRHLLQEGDAELSRLFETGHHARDLVPLRSNMIEALLRDAWEIHVSGFELPISLIAVGGFGRGELHPYSDVDLMILAEEEQLARIVVRHVIEHFITFLWDIGLEVGHSVRNMHDCLEEARRDATVATNLLESRLLVGMDAQFKEMCEATSPKNIWASRAFFRAKWDEQQVRHHKYHDTAYNLEPNIKEGPGGLRDIQMIAWVASRHFGATTLHDLVDHGFLTESEYAILIEGQHFLWQVRFALHLAADRREDRLLIDYQQLLALQFGYSDQADKLAVEQFMKRYYRTIMELSRLNEVLLQLFQEAILYADDSAQPVPINRRFQSLKGFIEVTREDVFLRYPFALLEVFLLLQQHPELKGVRASTIRLIRTYRDLINDDFRSDLRARSLFMEIIRQPSGITHALRRMNRYGILAAYIPVFGQIVGQMQYDLFHVYTVDEHTLMVVRNLRRLAIPKHFHEFPFCSQLIQNIPKIELLYLAAIFHDIAKGQGGDHSELGATIAEKFCNAHGLSSADTELAMWLVKNHLLMSITAQRSDTSDPEVITKFAQGVGDATRLDHLYLLTVADIRATNPEIWNSWKHTLLEDLYRNTRRALWRGPDFPLDKERRIRSIKAMAKAELRHDFINSEIQSHWDTLGDTYFLRYSPDEIIWHTQSILEHGEKELPLVLMRQEHARGSTALFIYTYNEDHLFTLITAVLDQMRLNIVDARIINSQIERTLDTYQILDENNEPITDNRRLKSIHDTLSSSLSGSISEKLNVSRSEPRQARHIPHTTHISFGKDISGNRTTLEVFTADRPGLLAQIGLAFATCGVRLQNAKITTLGNRAEDVFFLTDAENLALSRTEDFECLRRNIERNLEVIEENENGNGGH